MNRATWLQDRRMQKFRDVLSRWEAGELSLMEAAAALGVWWRHQDGTGGGCIGGRARFDGWVPRRRGRSWIFAAFVVEEEGPASTFRALVEVLTADGLPSSLYTDRGSHYFYTAKAGEAVDRERLTQVGRALDRLGIEHIAAYSPEARGRPERMFRTPPGRPAKGPAKAGHTV